VSVFVSGVEELPDNRRAVLIDRSLDRVMDLRERNEYRFFSGVRAPVGRADDTRFALVAGDEAFVQSASEAIVSIPTATALHQNYPNPFNPSTIIRYDIAEHSHVDLRIYDVRGALIKVLEDRERAPGRYEVGWNGENANGDAVASGVYFYRLRTAQFTKTRKMVFVK
jgi:hypothetical protein